MGCSTSWVPKYEEGCKYCAHIMEINIEHNKTKESIQPKYIRLYIKTWENPKNLEQRSKENYVTFNARYINQKPLVPISNGIQYKEIVI